MSQNRRHPTEIVSEIFPGAAILFLIAFLSHWLSAQVVVHGKHPIEPSVLAILLGLIARSRLTSSRLAPGLKFADQFLIYGIVLLGSTLSLSQLSHLGWPLLLIILGTMLCGLCSTFVIARVSKLSRELSTLLAAGTTICGTTAIAIIAPLIRARREETSYAVGVVALCGLVAILLYPIVGRELNVSDTIFGVFAGVSIHSTPQVVGAGYMYSDVAGQLATAVKLIRNCFIAPLALLIAIYFQGSSPEGKDLKRAFPWFLFGYFVMAGVANTGLLSQFIIDTFTEVGKFLIVVAMAGIGVNTDLRALRSEGIKPLLVGAAGTTIVAIAAMIMIYILL